MCQQATGGRAAATSATASGSSSPRCWSCARCCTPTARRARSRRRTTRDLRASSARRSTPSRARCPRSAARGLLKASTPPPTPTRTASGPGGRAREVHAARLRRDARARRPAGEADKNASLLGIFSQCKTAMGSRLFRKWFASRSSMRTTLASATTWSTPSSMTRRCGWRPATSACRRWAAISTARSASSRAGRRSAGDGRHRRHRRRLHHHRRLLTSTATPSPQDVVFLYQFVLLLPKLLQMPNSHDQASDDEAALVKRKFAAPLRRVHRFRAVPPPSPSAADLDAARRLEYIVFLGGGARLPRRAEGGLPRADRRQPRRRGAPASTRRRSSRGDKRGASRTA